MKIKFKMSQKSFLAKQRCQKFMILVIFVNICILALDFYLLLKFYIFYNIKKNKTISASTKLGLRIFD